MLTLNGRDFPHLKPSVVCQQPGSLKSPSSFPKDQNAVDFYGLATFSRDDFWGRTWVHQIFFLPTLQTVGCPVVLTSREQPYVAVEWIHSTKFNQMVSARQLDIEQMNTNDL